MRSTMTIKRLIIVPMLLGLATPSIAFGDKDDDDGDDAKKTRWGIGSTVRVLYAPEWLQEMFWDDSPGDAKDGGASIEFYRRTGSLELAIGFGYDGLELSNGYYLETGGDPMVSGEVQRNRFDGLQWYTAEVNIVNNLSVHKFLEIRFGAGIGVGYLRGDVIQSDVVCTTERIPDDCTVYQAGEVNVPADLPPVAPVVNVFVGLQLTPFDWLHLRIDAGIHTVPFVSAGAALYAW